MKRENCYSARRSYRFLSWTGKMLRLALLHLVFVHLYIFKLFAPRVASRHEWLAIDSAEHVCHGRLMKNSLFLVAFVATQCEAQRKPFAASQPRRRCTPGLRSARSFAVRKLLAILPRHCLVTHAGYVWSVRPKRALIF